MFQEEFNKIVSDHNQLLEFELADVRSICERYPYCQVAQVLYAKKLHLINNPQFENQLKKAATNIYDRTILYKFVEKTILSRTVAAGFEEEPESREIFIEPERIRDFQSQELLHENELEINPADLEEKVDSVFQMEQEEIISANSNNENKILEIKEAELVDRVPEIEIIVPNEELVIPDESYDKETGEDPGDEQDENNIEETIEGILELINEEEIISANSNNENKILEIKEAELVDRVPEIEIIVSNEELVIPDESYNKETGEYPGEEQDENYIEETIEGIPQLINEEELIPTEIPDNNFENQYIQPASVLEEFILNSLMDEEEMELPEEEERAALYGKVESEELPEPIIDFSPELNIVDEGDNELFKIDADAIDQIEETDAEQVVEVLSVQETEEILKTIMEGIPEIEKDLQIEQESNNNNEDPDQEILAEEQAILNLNESIINEESLEFDSVSEIDEVQSELISDSDNDAPDEVDDLIFEMPPYDIDRELGALKEEDIIKINIQIPVGEEYQPEKVYSDSFIGWINRLSGESKGREVVMKESNKPIKLYRKSDGQQSELQQEVRQEKVINEIIAADLARKSLESNDNLATETYARILVMQGKYSKAIEMYSKLSLLKPQKSDYFAALIDQIKKRIK